MCLSFHIILKRLNSALPTEITHMTRKLSIIFFTVFFSVTSCSKEDTILESNEETSIEEKQTIADKILVLVNKHRNNLGKSSLSKNTVAENLAKEHTNNMITKQKISHDGFDDRALELQEKVNAKSVGENVAAGFPTAAKVMEAWLNSPGHKANIEDDFTHIGIVAIKDSKGKYYFTQLFYR